MTILTISIPDGKAPDLSAFVKNAGGKIISTTKKKIKSSEEADDNDEVTHESYFGENIKRVIKAFKD